MSRQEHDREDLLAEATALTERAELRIAGEAEPLVAGFRRDGSASVYFGGDPAYHFNAAGELRRAFCSGILYKAERGKLVSLVRRRLPDRVELLRHELTADEQDAFLAPLTRRLLGLQTALAGGECQLVGQVPDTADVPVRIRRWLDALSLPPPIAATPRAGFG
ncbi:MAG: hypothetical protein B7Z73_08440 [Planctomycetia bacterium 21-64-5]|nr:MAG: hypothetical protein B7Z73_08440 [Planctomycetia bacterium 21-64-5]HQU43599.1 hypothetical protein [Pirellulales bacterium]